MLAPGDRQYSSDHVWVQVSGEMASAGITDHAQDELGEIVYLQLPEPNSTVAQGSSMGEIESVKTVSELICPVSGTVLQRNEGAIDKPGVVNSDPYGDGWLVRIQLSNRAELANLLPAAGYLALTEPSH